MGPRRLLVALGSLLLAACYETPKPACLFLCGDGDACPSGYACGDDDRCHLVQSGGGLAECPDPLPADAAAIDAPPDGPPIDASPIDATPIDAMPIDAMPIDAMPIDAMPIDATP